jgi:hypothetical protein
MIALHGTGQAIPAVTDLLQREIVGANEFAHLQVVLRPAVKGP